MQNRCDVLQSSWRCFWLGFVWESEESVQMQPVGWVGFKASEPLLGHLHLCGMMFLHTIHTCTHTHTPKTVRLSITRFFSSYHLSNTNSWSMLGSIMLGGCFIEAGAGRPVWVKRETEWHELSGALRTPDCTKGSPSNKRGQLQSAVFWVSAVHCHTDDCLGSLVRQRRAALVLNWTSY